MSSTNHTAAATQLRASTPKKLGDAHPDDLARAESEGMIAERTPPTPPTRRERAELLVSRLQARASQLVQSVKARLRAALGPDKPASDGDASTPHTR